MAKIKAATLSQIIGYNRPVVSSTGQVMTPSDMEELRKGDGLPISGGSKSQIKSSRARRSRPSPKPNKKRPTLIPYSSVLAATQNTKCPHCDCTLKLKNLVRHIKKCPKASNKEIPKTKDILVIKQKAKGSEKTIHIEPQKSGTVPDHLGSFDKYDASKGWGQAYRDSGKFGSYPIHDGFGDESNP
jgi:hypothetical protein